jgi:hypothetical protein
MAELGARGGRARGARKSEQAGDKLEQLATSALEELLQSSGSSATARVAAAKFALASIGDSSGSAVKLAKKALAAEYEAERQADLPAARARLDRLIEARATVLAEEMYEERKHLELEAVKAEMLGGP